MSARLKILMSAYSCEPGKGSEPEVGWQWATRMARHHDVTVLTRRNNRASIEAGLAAGTFAGLTFEYLDAPAIFLRLKKLPGGLGAYYALWQMLARRRLGKLCRESKFDLVHHTTYASCRFGAAIWGHGPPALWGPVGGLESAPWSLLPLDYPLESVKEAVRNLDTLAQKLPWSGLARRGRQSAWVLASTLETSRMLEGHGIGREIFPTIGLAREHLGRPSTRRSEGPLKLLFVGRFVWWKGMTLALEALAAAQADARLTFIGGGDESAAAGLRKLARRLGVEARVHFAGQRPRAEVFAAYAENDAFLFPSQHDSGGFAVIEAMAAGLPVICLDCGGPALAVGEGCGRRIPVGSRREVIAGLASAIEHYDTHRGEAAKDGACARLRILEEYEWDAKARRMDGIYRRVVEAHAVGRKLA